MTCVLAMVFVVSGVVLVVEAVVAGCIAPCGSSGATAVVVSRVVL